MDALCRTPHGKRLLSWPTQGRGLVISPEFFKFQMAVFQKSWEGLYSQNLGFKSITDIFFFAEQIL